MHVPSDWCTYIAAEQQGHTHCRKEWLFSRDELFLSRRKIPMKWRGVSITPCTLRFLQTCTRFERVDFPPPLERQLGFMPDAHAPADGVNRPQSHGQSDLLSPPKEVEQLKSRLWQARKVRRRSNQACFSALRCWCSAGAARVPTSTSDREACTSTCRSRASPFGSC